MTRECLLIVQAAITMLLIKEIYERTYGRIWSPLLPYWSNGLVPFNLQYSADVFYVYALERCTVQITKSPAFAIAPSDAEYLLYCRICALSRERPSSLKSVE